MKYSKRFWALLRLLAGVSLLLSGQTGGRVEASPSPPQRGIPSLAVTVESQTSTAPPRGASPLPSAGLSAQSSLETRFPDLDGDGIPNTLETAGWSNARGTFATDPYDSDSDDDGLSDGLELLYDTNPLDDTSPGISVEYTSALRTKKYFPWQRYGTRYIAHGEAPDPEDRAVVVRRGSSFLVRGPRDATLVITKSIPALTTLTPTPAPCQQGWWVTIPPDATVGAYTLTVQRGNWHKSLDLFVIFELPSDLPPEAVAVFVSNDDEQDNRDEHSVWYNTSEWVVQDINDEDGDGNTTEELYHWANGYSIAFPTDQYEAYILRTHVISNINGLTTQRSAFNHLLNYVDSITLFDASVEHYTMKEALNSYQRRNQCSNIANILTGFSRAAGIATRPETVDWDGYLVGSGKFDHATQVWLDGEWLTARGYNQDEPCDDQGTIACGVQYPRTADYWGRYVHQEKWADIIYTTGYSWTWTTVGDVYRGEYGRDYAWRRRDVAGNDTRDLISSEPWLETWMVPYWGWPVEPSQTTAPPAPYDREPAPGGGCSGFPCYDTYSPPPEGNYASLSATSAPSTSEAQPQTIGGIVRDYGVDRDRDGRFDQLVVDVSVDIPQAGFYTVGAVLNHPDFAGRSQSGGFASFKSTMWLEAGRQTVRLTFDGPAIARVGIAGTYTLEYMWLSATSDASNIVALNEALLELKPYVGRTHFYRPEAFEAPTPSPLPIPQQSQSLNGVSPASTSVTATAPITFTGIFTDTPKDEDGDGLYEALNITAQVEVGQPGSYRFSAWLQDAAGNLFAWNISAPISLPVGIQTISLPFDGQVLYQHGADGPYTLVMPKLLAGDTYIVFDQEHVGPTTAAYAPTDFTPPPDAVTLFQDNLEAGTANWQAEAPWALTDQSSFSPRHAWTDSPDGDYGNNVNLSLTTVPITFPAASTITLRFQTCNRFATGDHGYVEISTDGGTTWRQVADLTDYPGWSPITLDLTGSEALSSLQLRFRLQTDGATTADGWYLDNILLVGDLDADDDGIANADEDANGNGDPTDDDTDGDGTPDYLDTDADGDGIPDATEGTGDADNDGTPNYLDPDADGDGIPDADEGTGDADNDGTPNYLDTDADGDGIPDADEGTGDADNDGTPNYLDTDADGDTIPDATEGTDDADNDGTPNFLDTDADGDGIPDATEGTGDTDNDGIPNYLDPDADGDGIPDNQDPDPTTANYTVYLPLVVRTP